MDIEPLPSAVKRAKELGLPDLPDGTIVSPERKYCAGCGATPEYLAKQGKSLVKCKQCPIGLFCGLECQMTNTLYSHLMWCIGPVQQTQKQSNEIRFDLLDHGFDVNRDYNNDRKTFIRRYWPVHEFVEVFANDCQVKCSFTFSLALQSESYSGVQLVLDELLKSLKMIQPMMQHLRWDIPMVMIVLKQDSEAYNFIKFWLNRVKKSKYGLYNHIHKKLPKLIKYAVTNPEDVQSPEITMDGQDKTEDIFNALEISIKRSPYEWECINFIYLAIIKINTMLELKDDDADVINEQRKHFFKYLDYVEDHYPNLARHYLTVKDFDSATEADNYDMFEGQELINIVGERKKWLAFYLKRAPRVKKALVNYFIYRSTKGKGKLKSK